MKVIKRIAIIGNGGGGKTTLAKSLAERYSLPLTHVDSIQYLAGMKVRDTKETSRILTKCAEKSYWLIDGFGSYEVMNYRRRSELGPKTTVWKSHGPRSKIIAKGTILVLRNYLKTQRSPA